MSMRIENPTFGSDFEALVQGTDDRIIPVVGLIGGTKRDPLSIGNDCFCQQDNVCAEFNIPPVTNVQDWVKYINYAINTGNEILDPHKLLFKSSHIFDIEELFSHPSLMEFGCEPSFSTYTKRPLRVDSTKIPGLRSAGFHIHVGFKGNATRADITRFIQLMDYTVGRYTVQVDEDRQRRILYGRAGEYRFKHTRTGLTIIEYRSVGSGVIKSDDNLRDLFHLTEEAIELFNNNRRLSSRELIENRKLIDECQKIETLLPSMAV